MDSGDAVVPGYYLVCYNSSKAKKKTESNTTKQVEFPLTRKKQNAKAKLMARDLIL